MINYTMIRFVMGLLRREPRQGLYLPRFFRSMSSSYLWFNQIPWITFEAIDYLDSLDLSGKKVFEFGSGASTLFWLRKQAIVTSIEHNQNFYNKLSKLFVDSNQQLDYRLVKPKRISDCQIEVCSQVEYYSNPSNYASGNSNYYGFEFKDYVDSIKAFPDNYFDIVMIDGRARSSAINSSINKLSKDGCLIVDNADRSYYYTFNNVNLKKGFTRISFKGLGPCLGTSSYYWITDFFKKK